MSAKIDVAKQTRDINLTIEDFQRKSMFAGAINKVQSEANNWIRAQVTGSLASIR